MWDPLRISATVEASNFKFGIQLGCLTYQTTTFRTKIGRGSGQGASPKNWDPLRIFATVEASNFKLSVLCVLCTFGTFVWQAELSFIRFLLTLGLTYQKTTFRTKIGRGSGQGASPKNWDPPTYFCNR